jgi:hypothetical protein
MRNNDEPARKRSELSWFYMLHMFMMAIFSNVRQTLLTNLTEQKLGSFTQDDDK